MNSKKAQSEIITTVLIILLVLAAIVIVWMVVQGTLKGTSKQIDTGAACIGIETTVLSAKSAETLGSCSDPLKTTKTDCVAPAIWDPAANGQVVVQRNSASSDYNVKAIVYVNGISTGLESGNLRALESKTIDLPTQLATPGAPRSKVKAVTVLVDKQDPAITAVCPTSQEVDAS